MMPDVLTLERRYIQGTNILAKLLMIQKEIRGDVCIFLRRRMNNQRGLREYNKILEEMKVVDDLMERLKKEVRDKLIVPGAHVTGEIAVYVRNTMNTLKRLGEWANM